MFLASVLKHFIYWPILLSVGINRLFMDLLLYNIVDCSIFSAVVIQSSHFLWYLLTSCGPRGSFRLNAREKLFQMHFCNLLSIRQAGLKSTDYFSIYRYHRKYNCDCLQHIYKMAMADQFSRQTSLFTILTAMNAIKNIGHLFFLLPGFLFLYRAGHTQSPLFHTVAHSTKGYTIKKAFGLPNGKSSLLNLATTDRIVCSVVNIKSSVANSFDITGQLSSQNAFSRSGFNAVDTHIDKNLLLTHHLRVTTPPSEHTAWRLTNPVLLWRAAQSTAILKSSNRLLMSLSYDKRVFHSIAIVYVHAYKLS